MNALRTVLMASACLLTSLGVRALDPVTTTPGFTPLTQAQLPDGRKLLAGFLETARGISVSRQFAVERHDTDGSVDTTFGGGVVGIPIWGYLEGAYAIAVRPDGAIYLAGMASDPIAQVVGTDFCYPAFCEQYVAIVRLKRDGELDTSFNGNGRVVLRFGSYEQYDDAPDYANLKTISLQEDGKILVDTNFGLNTARINSDGTIDDSFEPPYPITMVAAGVPSAGANFQDLWWNPAEPGWNISFAHQGDVLFATWATYDMNGKPMWLSMAAIQFAPGTYAGTLYHSTGPAYTTFPFDPSKVKLTEAGNAVLVFGDDGHARFGYQAFGVSATKDIQRYAFNGSFITRCTWGGPQDAANLQGLWYAAPAGSEPGWGVSIAPQGNALAITLLTYDLDGSPLWLYGEVHDDYGDEYQGGLYGTAGPWFGTPAFAAHPITATAAAGIDVSGAYGNNMALSIYMNGAWQEKDMTRYVFRGSATTCE